MHPTPTTTAASPTPRPAARARDALLLLFCCSLLAARSQINESFARLDNLADTSPNLGQAGPAAPALFAAAVLAAGLIWLLSRPRSTTWRTTGLGLPLALLLAAAALSTAYASNRHAAALAAATLVSQVLLALLLIQLLDAPWKIRLVLATLAAGGVAQAYRCWEQYSYELPLTHSSFLADPNTVLLRHGLEPGSYAAHQFAARVASRDVAGHFAVSNTAASFLILAAAAAATLLPAALRRPRSPAQVLLLLSATILVLAPLAALALTKSKGALAAAAAAAFLLLVGPRRAFFQRRWRSALIAVALLLTLAVAAIVAYGQAHGRLPSNSLWVRWQYWTAAAKMIRDHPLTGVGAENFGAYYPRYLPLGAPEVVKDPHCLPLALASQYGLLGLAAFLAAIVSVTLRLARPPQPATNAFPASPTPAPHAGTRCPPAARPSQPALWPFALLITIATLAVRLAVSDLGDAGSLAERFSLILLTFILPAVLWLSAFLIFAAAASPPSSPAAPASGLILAAGLAAFLLHNTIDFAFFQPGVGAAFFAALATLIALRLPPSPRSLPRPLAPTAWALASFTLAASFAAWLFFAIPAARAQRDLDLAARALYPLAPEPPAPRPLRNPLAILAQAESLTLRAAARTPCDPQPPAFAAELALQQWRLSPAHDPHALNRAADLFRQALARDPANPSYYGRLARLYEQAADRPAAPPDPRALDYARQAIDYARQQALRSPTLPEPLLQYARLLAAWGPPLGVPDWHTPAAHALRQALDSDDALARQLQRMFPRQTPTPRLNPRDRRQAEALLLALSPAPPAAPPAAPVP